MTVFTTTCEVRWADLDPNGHARHTAFMDWATHSRLVAFASVGVTTAVFQALGVGFVVFREETDYLQEVSGEDQITIAVEFTGASPDWKHCRIRHVLTRQDGVHCATVVVRGAWFNLRERKVTFPPERIAQACQALPRAADFEVLDRGSRQT